MNSKKPTIGDVVEISTPRGLAYVQYTHSDRDMGELVRVIPGLYASRPLNLAELVRGSELYFVFYTLMYAVRAGQAKIVLNEPVPEHARAEPLRRHASGRAPDGKITGWRIVPALHPLTVDFLLKTPVLRSLTDDQLRLSIHHLWPHPVLVKELAREWSPLRAESLEEQDREKASAKNVNQRASGSADDTLRHYLYFPAKKNAVDAGQELQSRGYSVEVRKGADGVSWLALARKLAPKTDEQMDELRAEMETLAAQFHGEYDGWEAAIGSTNPESSGRTDKIN